MVLIPLVGIAAGILIAKRKAKTRSQETTAGVLSETTPIAEPIEQKNIVQNLNGEMKLSSVVVREEESSAVLLWATGGELHGNGDGFLALTAKNAELRGKITKGMRCVVDMVNEEGIILERITMVFDRRSFGNVIFTNEV
jgi:hypothetical protein